MSRWIRQLAFVSLFLLSGTSLLGAATKPNIILITLESTRADRLGFLGFKGKTTPNLDGVSRDSLIFEQAYAQSPLTVSSHATILTGIYPQTLQVSEFGTGLSASLPYLPDLLRSRGYQTAAFVGSVVLSPSEGFAAGFDRGFDTYDAKFGTSEKNYASGERTGIQVVDRANAWISQHAQGPFFVWIHLNDPQAPYTASYNAAIAAADNAAGKLIANLRAKKMYDGTLIVVAADHGESLGSHGEETHGIFLYDETVRVPLLVKLPANQDAGKRVRAKARLVDLAPSVLEAAGVPVPSQMQGQSLLRLARGGSMEQPVYSRSELPQKGFGWSLLESWRAGKYLYIRAPQPELYDLSTDPGATKNLASSSKAILDTMATQLLSFSQRLTPASGKSGQAQLSSSEVQKLASLGYVGLQKSGAGVDTAASGTNPKDGIANANRVLNELGLWWEGKPAKASTSSPIAGLANSYLAQFALGISLVRQQQFSQAIPFLHRAIELQPDSGWAHLAMGQSLLQAGDNKTAVVHLEIAASRLPSLVASHSLLAQAYERLGKTQEAQQERAKAGHLNSLR